LSQVDSEWVRSLDADYVLGDDLVSEIGSKRRAGNVRRFWARFVYQIFGRSLSASLYPRRAVHYCKASAAYVDAGQRQRVRIGGNTEPSQSDLCTLQSARVSSDVVDRAARLVRLYSVLQPDGG